MFTTKNGSTLLLPKRTKKKSSLSSTIVPHLNPLTSLCRKRKITTGPFNFQSFIRHKDATGQQHAGVEEWGVGVVYDIFSCLSHVADIGVVEVRSSSLVLIARFPKTILGPQKMKTTKTITAKKSKAAPRTTMKTTKTPNPP